MANVQDGVYDFVGDTISSFRRLDAASIQQFQLVLASAEAGRTRPDEVISEAVAINPALGKLVATLQAVGGIPLLVALLALWLQYAAGRDDDADQEAVISELRASNAHQEEIIDEMRKLVATQNTPPPQPYSSPKSETTRILPNDVLCHNRATRRRALKQERKTTREQHTKRSI